MEREEKKQAMIEVLLLERRSKRILLWEMVAILALWTLLAFLKQRELVFWSLLLVPLAFVWPAQVRKEAKDKVAQFRVRNGV